MKFIYQWVPTHIYAPLWMARAFYSVQRNECLFVLPPLNLIVALAWWAQDKWARAAHYTSWIDREVNRRVHAQTYYRNH